MENLSTVVYENQIVVYWNMLFEVEGSIVYKVYVNGEAAVETQKTHYELKCIPNSEYEIKVTAVNTDDAKVYSIGETVVKTLARKKRIDVSKAPYFAVGDGKTLNTVALQKAFDDCKEGETVYFPKGVYLTGSLTVYSGAEVYLDEGAILQGSTQIKDYLPMIVYRWEGINRIAYSPLIKSGTLDESAKPNVHDISFRGGGEITGGGLELFNSVLRAELKEKIDLLYDSKSPDVPEVVEAGRKRPFLIEINNAENVKFTGVKISNGPAWNLHICYSENIVISNCEFESFGLWNGDGIDPDSCVNTDIFDCKFHTGDDAIAIKSGKNPEGNVVNKCCKNLRIFDVEGRNGISIGSEMSGGIENVLLWDLRMAKDSCACLNIKVTEKRGGYVKNVHGYNISGPSIKIRNVTFNNDGEAAPSIPVLENISFENIVLTGCCGLYNKIGEDKTPVLILNGFPKGYELKNVRFKNVGIKNYADGGYQQMQIKNVKNLCFENIYSIEAETNNK